MSEDMLRKADVAAAVEELLEWHDARRMELFRALVEIRDYADGPSGDPRVVVDMATAALEKRPWEEP